MTIEGYCQCDRIGRDSGNLFHKNFLQNDLLNGYIYYI
jgi:hypothetical protein